MSDPVETLARALWAETADWDDSWAMDGEPTRVHFREKAARYAPQIVAEAVAAERPKRSMAELHAALDEIADLAPSGTRWRHLKTKEEYLVCGHCYLEATCAPAIMYCTRKGGASFVWVRDAEEFLDGRFLRLAKNKARSAAIRATSPAGEGGK